MLTVTIATPHQPYLLIYIISLLHCSSEEYCDCSIRVSRSDCSIRVYRPPGARGKMPQLPPLWAALCTSSHFLQQTDIRPYCVNPSAWKCQSSEVPL